MAHNPFEAIEELCDLMPGLELHPGTSAHISAEPPPGRATALPSRQEFFPLMKLPIEVRFMIYEIALQQTLDHAISPPFGTPRLMPAPTCTPRICLSCRKIYHDFPEVHKIILPMVGALALLHTNRELRSECAEEFMRLGPTHVKALKACKDDFFRATPDDELRYSNSRVPGYPLFKIELWEAERDLAMFTMMFIMFFKVQEPTSRSILCDLDGKINKHLAKCLDVLRSALAKYGPDTVLAPQRP
jgi:hypothetical protein